MAEIYRVYDDQDRLLYIGVTNNMKRRKGYHRSCTEWYPDAARWKVREYISRATAEKVEARAIRLLRPMHNIVSQLDQAERWGTGVPLPFLTRKARKASLQRMAADNKEEDDV